jgi:VCBS repeat-containing protein
LEGSTRTFTPTDFGYSDSAENHQFSALHIVTIPDQGTLQITGNDVSAGDVISWADLDSSGLRYLPPANTTGTDTTGFLFAVQDNGGGADTDPTPNQITITNIGVNDPPIAGSGNTLTVYEDTAHTLQPADFAYTDIENHAIMNVLIESEPTSGVIYLNDIPVVSGDSVSISDIANDRMVFHPANNQSGLDSFTFRIQDDGGRDHLGNDLSIGAGRLYFDVQPVNDAPLVESNTIAVIEDTDFVLNAEHFRFTDLEDHSLKQVSITNVPDSGALLKGNTVISAGENITLSELVSGALRYAPAPDINGAGVTSIEFTITDDGGTNFNGTDTSTTSASIFIDIIAVNDTPQATDNTVSTLEDTELVIQPGMFGFSDIDNDPLAGISIAALPQNGTLTLNAMAVSVGDTISAADVSNNLLSFVPDANASGTGYAQVAFYVIDSAGAVSTAPGANILTIDVTAVSDAPSVANTTIALSEDSIYTLNLNDFAFSDAQDAPFENSFEAIIVTAPSLQGTLNNQPVIAGTEITAAQIDSGELQFTPEANAFGNNYTAFEFIVRDDGNTENGGTNSSSDATVFIFSVSAVNDAPVAENDSFNAEEGAVLSDTVINNDSDIDVDDSLLAALTTAPEHGSLELNDDGSFVYSHDGSESTIDHFTYEISDGSLTDTAEVTITIIPVNDPPLAGAAGPYTVVAGQPSEITLPNDLFVDADDGDTLSLQLLNPDGTPAPRWISLNENSMSIRATAPLDGLFIVRLIATDTGNQSAFTDVVLQVLPNSSEPQIGAALAAEQTGGSPPTSDNVALGSTDGSALSFTGFANNPSNFEKQQPPPDTADLIFSVPEVTADYEPLVELALQQHNQIRETQTDTAVIEPIQVETVQPLEALFQMDNQLLGFSNNGLSGQLDSSKQGMTETNNFSLQVTTGVTGVSVGLSIGYIVWLLRGGVLISSVLTSLPAWRMIDPLPVLPSTDSGDDGNDDESLHDIVDSKDRPASKNQANTDPDTSDISPSGRSRQ